MIVIEFVRFLLHHERLVHPTSKEWVIFIHGAGGNLNSWNRQRTAFSSEFNVLLIDLRDHGDSKNISPEHSNYRFEIISRDVKTLLDHYGIKKANFVTLSFGSVLIQDFSQRYPSLVGKTVFAGAVFSGGFQLRLFIYTAKLLNLFLSYPTMYRLFSYVLMPDKHSQVARKLYQRQSQQLSSSEYMKWVGLYREFFRLLASFRKQSLPFRSLVVMGQKDYMFLKSAARFCSNQPKVDLSLIPDTGHICNIENPSEFNKRVIRFLTSEA